MLPMINGFPLRPENGSEFFFKYPVRWIRSMDLLYKLGQDSLDILLKKYNFPLIKRQERIYFSFPKYIIIAIHGRHRY